jgi:membrane associated rhomboid family serine protease
VLAVNAAVYVLPLLPRRDLPREIWGLVDTIPTPMEGGLIPAAVIQARDLRKCRSSHFCARVSSPLAARLCSWKHICASVQDGQWHRLVWSALLHGDVYHLYYNMTSLLWKGLQLEPALGRMRYALLLLELWLAGNVMECIMLWGVKQLLGQYPPVLKAYFRTASVGFSGVLFGLKTVLSASEHQWQYVHLPMVGSVNLPPKVCA